MVKYISKFNVITALALLILLVFLLFSGCNIFGDSDRPAPSPPSSGILTPQDNTRVAINGPVQILSAFENVEAISRLELWVQRADEETAKLLRSDTVDGRTVLQEWVPLEQGQYSVIVRAYTANDNQNPVADDAVTLNVVDAPIKVPEPGDPQQAAEFKGPAQATAVPPTPLPTSPATPAGEGAAGGFQPPPPSEQLAVQVVATSTPLPTPTPIIRYPPPPPAPGVFPGPTQEELPKLFPPVCDAAEYLGPYVPSTREQIVITEPDNVPATTVGGTKVLRAWRLRNVGTCTWGPGYELAFYGGRSMGSGGVAFEGFLTEPERRNVVTERNQLIEPEGQPNQVAVLQVLLNVPVTPGIHQSYWRMRNPQGVFFGPIIGVTLEVVRECDFGIYGAPFVNEFQILVAGEVFRPVDPTRATIERGVAVTVEWDIVNADSYDLLVRGPTGGIDNLSTGSLIDRRTFVPRQLGEYIVTLVANNGSCTASADVVIDVVPGAAEPFDLDIIVISSVNDIQAQWSHPDPQADSFPLWAQPVRLSTDPQCFLTDCTGEWWGSWSGVCEDLLCTPTEEWVATGEPRQVIEGASAQGEVRVAGVASQLCPPTPADGTQFGVKYFMTAEKNNQFARPAKSEEVIVECDGAPLPSSEPGPRLPDEIPSP